MSFAAANRARTLGRKPKPPKPPKPKKKLGGLSPTTTRRLAAIVEEFDANQMKLAEAKATKKQWAAQAGKKAEEIFDLGRRGREDPAVTAALPQLEREREKANAKLAHAEAEVKGYKEALNQAREQVFDVIRSVAKGESLFDGDGTPPPKASPTAPPSSTSANGSNPAIQCSVPGVSVGGQYRILKSSREIWKVTVEKITTTESVAVIIDEVIDTITKPKPEKGQRPIIVAKEWDWAPWGQHLN